MEKKARAGILLGLLTLVGIGGFVSNGPKALPKIDPKYSLVIYDDGSKTINQYTPKGLDVKGIEYDDYPVRVIYDYDGDGQVDEILGGGEVADFSKIPSVKDYAVEFGSRDTPLSQKKVPISGSVSREFLEANALLEELTLTAGKIPPFETGEGFKAWGENFSHWGLWNKGL
jgi:hypothetical protein